MTVAHAGSSAGSSGPWGAVFMDHLAVAAPDLASGVRYVEDRLGVSVRPGGVHPQWGTRNALVHCADSVFLEVIGPDPERAAPGPVTLFGIDRLDGPRLSTWVIRTTGLERRVTRAAAAGLDLGSVLSGRRRRPDGSELTWSLTDPLAARMDQVVPFLIDWGDTPHPTTGQQTDCRLVALELTHPDAAAATAVLEALGVGIAVREGDSPGLRAHFETPRGLVVLE